MVNKCSITNCSTDYKGGENIHSIFHSNRNYKREKIGHPLVPCITHLQEKYVKLGKKCKLQWELQPIATIHTDLISKPSFVVPRIPKRPPMKRNTLSDERDEFKTNDEIMGFSFLKSDICPKLFTFIKQESAIMICRLVVDEITHVPDIQLIKMHMSLSYCGYHVPLPEWFRYGHNCKLV